jgi:hypothetical protein
MLWILVSKLLGGRWIRIGKSVYSRYVKLPSGEAKEEVEGREGLIIGCSIRTCIHGSI